MAKSYKVINVASGRVEKACSTYDEALTMAMAFTHRDGWNAGYWERHFKIVCEE